MSSVPGYVAVVAGVIRIAALEYSKRCDARFTAHEIALKDWTSRADAYYAAKPWWAQIFEDDTDLYFRGRSSSMFSDAELISAVGERPDGETSKVGHEWYIRTVHVDDGTSVLIHADHWAEIMNGIGP